MQVQEFVRIKGELSVTLGRRFELFCAELLVEYFEELGVGITHVGGPSDKGRDIIIEVCGYRGVIQCKAYFCQNIERRHIDEFRKVVKDGCFDFGVFVGVSERRISVSAYSSAARSECDTIVTTYRNMCRDIKNLIAGRLKQKYRVLENRLGLEQLAKESENRFAKLEQKQTQIITNEQEVSLAKNISSLIEDQSNKDNDITLNLMYKHNSTQTQRSNFKFLTDFELSITSLPQDIIDDNLAKTQDFIERI
ncbi:11143_t:CDS:2 [Acaulospora morrowiae]|uniref:11143_t:CDS:1 n=1 Tax=Acaulospora morrowiae TaxID=94023 RepID=A0A9N9BM00_9GLOM|nr:11143_t:CDS:2 [Acaulospora morrowiae]